MSDGTVSTNERAETLMGRRLGAEQEERGVVAFDMPVELGFVCPVCKVQSEGLAWSSTAGFLWCDTCNIDIPSALCVPFDGDRYSEHDWVNHGIHDAIKVYLDTVEQAVRRSARRASVDQETPRG